MPSWHVVEATTIALRLLPQQQPLHRHLRLPLPQQQQQPLHRPLLLLLHRRRRRSFSQHLLHPRHHLRLQHLLQDLTFPRFATSEVMLLTVAQRPALISGSHQSSTRAVSRSGSMKARARPSSLSRPCPPNLSGKVSFPRSQTECQFRQTDCTPNRLTRLAYTAASAD